jgi:kynurenine formamidase
MKDDGVYDRDLALPEHVGTHLDAPAHFDARGAFAHELPAERLVVPARVVDVRADVGDDPDVAIEPSAVAAHEGAHGRLDPGEAVLFRTGWERHLHDHERYVGPAEGPPRFPGLAPATAGLLIERGVAGIGIDTLGVDPGAAEGYPVHRLTLPAGLWHLEGLVGLEALPPRGAWLIIGLLPIVAGSGAPARVLALLRGGRG